MELDGLRFWQRGVREPAYGLIGNGIEREDLDFIWESLGRDPDGPEIVGIELDVDGLGDEENAGFKGLAIDGEGAVLFDTPGSAREEESVKIDGGGYGSDRI